MTSHSSDESKTVKIGCFPGSNTVLWGSVAFLNEKINNNLHTFLKDLPTSMFRTHEVQNCRNI